MQSNIFWTASAERQGSELTQERSRVALLAASFFLLSLINHWVVPWFAGALLLFIYTQLYGVRLHKRVLLECFVLVFIIAVFALKFVLFDLLAVAQASVGAFRNNAIVFVVLVFIWGLLRSIVIIESPHVVRRAVEILLVAHLILFYLQFLVFFLTGHYIDYVQPFTGEASRYIGFDKSLGIIGGVRPTGFYAEPSNFAGAVFFLLAALKVQDGLKVDWVVVLSLIAIFLAFSTAGLILGCALLALLVIGNKNRLLIGFFFITIIVSLIFIFSDELSSLYLAQEKKYSASSEIRFALLDFVLMREGIPFFLGYGPFGVEPSLYAATTDTAGGRLAASLTDSGAFVFLMLMFGLLGAPIYFLLLYIQHKNYMQTAFFVVGTFAKITIFSPLWLLFFVLLVGVKRSEVR